ncbi:LOW QUALITY PROTEIN: protein TOPAZ1 [Hyperolius riggenbachi]|uniref:LOW QUALITY PROTEIN: protein TOPAZ1 n=1 Tax=Hyperolius riggenbachi TaxID=752182 RepID=UPI0035A29C41
MCYFMSLLQRRTMCSVNAPAGSPKLRSRVTDVQRCTVSCTEQSRCLDGESVASAVKKRNRKPKMSAYFESYVVQRKKAVCKKYQNGNKGQKKAITRKPKSRNARKADTDYPSEPKLKRRQQKSICQFVRCGITDTDNQQCERIVKRRTGTSSVGPRRQQASDQSLLNGDVGPSCNNASSKQVQSEKCAKKPKSQMAVKRTIYATRLHTAVHGTAQNWQAEKGDCSEGRPPQHKRGRKPGSVQRIATKKIQAAGGNIPHGSEKDLECGRDRNQPQKKKRGRKPGILCRRTAETFELLKRGRKQTAHNVSLFGSGSCARNKLEKKKRGRPPGTLNRKIPEKLGQLETEKYQTAGNDICSTGSYQLGTVVGYSGDVKQPLIKKRGRQRKTALSRKTLDKLGLPETVEKQAIGSAVPSWPTERALGCFSEQKEQEKRKRGRPATLKRLIKLGLHETEENQAVGSDILYAVSDQNDTVQGCTDDMKQPEKKKRGRRPGTLTRNKLDTLEIKDKQEFANFLPAESDLEGVAAGCSGDVKQTEKRSRKQPAPIKRNTLNKQSAPLRKRLTRGSDTLIVGTSQSEQVLQHSKRDGQVNKRGRRPLEHGQRKFCVGKDAGEKLRTGQPVSPVWRALDSCDVSEAVKGQIVDTCEEEPVEWCGDAEKLERMEAVRKKMGESEELAYEHVTDLDQKGNSNISKAYVRVQRLVTTSHKSGASSITEQKDEHQLLESNHRPHPLEKSTGSSNSSDHSCAKMELRNDRRSKRLNHYGTVKGNPNSVGIAESTKDSISISVPCTRVKDQHIREEQRKGNICSPKACISKLKLQNPVVTLKKLRSPLKLRISEKCVSQPGNMTSYESDSPMPVVSAGDILTMENHRYSTFENKELETSVRERKKTQTKRVMKVKLDFKKRQRNMTVIPANGDPDTSANGSINTKENNFDYHFKAEQGVNTESSDIDGELNNTLSVNFDLDEILQQSTTEGYDIYNFWGSWRNAETVVSERENSDDSISLWSSLSADSYSQLPEDECKKFSCRRTVPFTGKTIWTCSCARTSIWTFSRKRPGDNLNTEIIMPTLEMYSNEMPSLQEEMTRSDNEASCKKRKLDLLLDLPPLNINSTNPVLEEFISSTCSELISDVPQNREVVCSTNTAEPHLSKYKKTAVSITSSTDFEPVSVPNVNAQSSKPHVSDPPTKTYVVPKLSQLIGVMKPPVFVAPIKSEIKEPCTNKVPFLNSKESSKLLQDDVSILGSEKSLPNEISNSIPVSSEKFVPVVLSDDDDPSKELEMNTENMDKEHINPTLFDLDPSTSSEGSGEGCSGKDISLQHADIRDSVLGCDALIAEKAVLSDIVPDFMKAYEEDALILDVIPDDPDLFDWSPENERKCPNLCNHSVKNNATLPVQKITPPSWTAPQKKISPEPNRKSNPQLDVCPPASCTETETSFSESSRDVDNSPLPEEDLEFEEPSDPPEQPIKANHEYSNPTEPPFAGGESSSSFPEVLPIKLAPAPLRPPLNSQIELPINEKCLPWMHEKNDFQGSVQVFKPPPDGMGQNRGMWHRDNTFHRRPPWQPWIPNGYCAFFYNPPYECFKKSCMYIHGPKEGDEKLCMDLLRRMIAHHTLPILKRAIVVFTEYYRQYPRRMNYEEEVFRALLIRSLKYSWWTDAFQLLKTATRANIVPSVEIIIKVFEHVVSSGLQSALPELMRVFSKFLDDGLKPTLLEISHIISTLNTLPNTAIFTNFLSSVKSRIEAGQPKNALKYNLNAAAVEIEHCKVTRDWRKLGSLYLSVCTGCENVTKLKNFARCIAEALMKESVYDNAEIPYCEFAGTIFKDPQLNDLHKTIVGRIGISVMFFYYRKELWHKGRTILHKFHELKINFSVLKGIAGPEAVLSRCAIVNVAVEIFLACEKINSAIQALKESDWIIQSPLWPCEKMDVLKRHSLLCNMVVQEGLSKSMFQMCFEILQNLPGFRESQADFIVSQYSCLFNQVLSSSIANQSLSISSLIVEFMVGKKVPIDYVNIRELITHFGHSGLYIKARECYKCASSLGFYSVFDRNTNLKILHIPSFMSDVEMLLTIERFIVSNASSIKSQGGCNENLQIILRKMVREVDKAAGKDPYLAAVERLNEAGRLSSPRLFIKHVTVNSNNEQVYILDHYCCFKWLKENISWAQNTWSFH